MVEIAREVGFSASDFAVVDPEAHIITTAANETLALRSWWARHVAVGKDRGLPGFGLMILIVAGSEEILKRGTILDSIGRRSEQAI